MPRSLNQRGFVGLSDSYVNSQETSWQLSRMIPEWLALSHMAELSSYTPQWIWSSSRRAFPLFSSQLNIWLHDLTNKKPQPSVEVATVVSLMTVDEFYIRPIVFFFVCFFLSWNYKCDAKVEQHQQWDMSLSTVLWCAVFVFWPRIIDIGTFHKCACFPLHVSDLCKNLSLSEPTQTTA